MPRANRYYIPNTVWHITHRCHKKDFLLKFARDKRRWIYWLFQAKKRFRVNILNFCVTSNHIHLLLTASKDDAIAKSLQLIAGRVAYEYNFRKKRQGAFWSDRYHATAVGTGSHLLNCIVYIDMNMVRAGVVKHPKDWEFSGYNLLVTPPDRCSIIDYSKLLELTDCNSLEEFRKLHADLIEKAISEKNQRDLKWTTSLAVGSEKFVSNFKSALRIKALKRKIVSLGNTHILKEEPLSYN